MLLSDPFPFALRGKPAQLRVVRNNGHCWGEIRCGAERYAVMTARDLYERTDEDAARTLISAAQRKATLWPSLLVT